MICLFPFLLFIFLYSSIHVGMLSFAVLHQQCILQCLDIVVWQTLKPVYVISTNVSCATGYQLIGKLCHWMTLFVWNGRNRYKPNQYNAGNIRECSSIIENISFLVNNRIYSKLSVARTELMHLNRYREFKQFLIIQKPYTRFIPLISNILIV